MLISRRSALQMGASLAVAPWVGRVSAAASAQGLFSTGSAKVDLALGGGVRTGSLIVVIAQSDNGGGENGFLARMARVNRVPYVHVMTAGTADILSLMQGPDGQRTGCLLLNSSEPITDRELDGAERDPKARDVFLSRWLKRSREVVRESGGIMAIRLRADPAVKADWISIPDYVVTADESVIKQN